MSLILVLLGIALIALLDHFWVPFALRSLRGQTRLDKLLVEPEETVCCAATVENRSRLPIPFIRLQVRFPMTAKLIAEEKWKASHCQMGIYQWQVEEKLALMPMHKAVHRVRFSAPSRGEYRMGDFRLSAGDLLGLREQYAEGQGQSLVVMPCRARSQQAIQAIGGFIGDISVRRFILEDPVLTVGFRDYTGREPMKSVSWKRTAVTGSLQVKQYDHTAEQTVTVLLNLENGRPEEIEACFRLARTACETLEKNKIPFALRTNGNLPGPVGKLFYIPDGLGGSHLNTILMGLGRADYTCYHSFRTMVKKTLQNRKSNESFLVITPGLGKDTDIWIRQLEAAGGNRICLLDGKKEAAV